jgi:hypothetical protein
MGGAPQVFVKQGVATNSTTSLAVDAKNVYWTNDVAAGSVSYVPLGGNGGMALSLAMSQTTPINCVSDGTNVYWTSFQPGTVAKIPIPITPGMSVMATTLASNQAQPLGIAVDATSVYWADHGAASVLKVPIGGGVPLMLASTGNGTNNLAVDRTSVYWTTNAGVAKTSINAMNGSPSPVPLAVNQNAAAGIAVDDKRVYWLAQGTVANNYNDGTVMAVAK